MLTVIALLSIIMADTQEKPSGNTEQPGNSVEATSSTQDKRSHGECVQVGDAEDKVISFDPPRP